MMFAALICELFKVLSLWFPFNPTSPAEAEFKFNDDVSEHSCLPLGTRPPGLSTQEPTPSSSSPLSLLTESLDACGVLGFEDFEVDSMFPHHVIIFLTTRLSAAFQFGFAPTDLSNMLTMRWLLVLNFVALMHQIVHSFSSNVADMPTLASTDVIEFYYLETSLPFNTPSFIRYSLLCDEYYCRLECMLMLC